MTKTASEICSIADSISVTMAMTLLSLTQSLLLCNLTMLRVPIVNLVR